MREIIAYIVLGLVIILYIQSLIEKRSLEKNVDSLTDQINNEYAKKQVELENSLTASRRTVDLLADSLATTRNSLKVSILKENSLNRELKEIKGRYTNKTKSELTLEMEKRSGGEPIEPYFLEVDDSLQVYKQRDSIHLEINTKLLTTIDIQDAVIKHKDREIDLLEQQNELTAQQLATVQDELKRTERRLKTAKVLGIVKDVLIIGGVGALLLL